VKILEFAFMATEIYVRSMNAEIILKPTRFFSTATRVLVTAMEEAQVKRLICVTGFGAGGSGARGGCAAFRGA
jgi:hypothetical protein